MIDTELDEQETDVQRDAHRLLERHGHPCNRVVSVDRDSVLFLNSQKQPRTAWLHTPAGCLLPQVTIAAGWVAEPPEGWPAQPPYPMASASGH